MFVFVRPFLAKIGRTYAHAEVINKSFVGFIFLVLIVSAVMTEIIGIHALFGAFMAGGGRIHQRPHHKTILPRLPDQPRCQRTTAQLPQYCHKNQQYADTPQLRRINQPDFRPKPAVWRRPG